MATATAAAAAAGNPHRTHNLSPTLDPRIRGGRFLFPPVIHHPTPFPSPSPQKPAPPGPCGAGAGRRRGVQRGYGRQWWCAPLRWWKLKPRKMQPAPGGSAGCPGGGPPVSPVPGWWTGLRHPCPRPCPIRPCRAGLRVPSADAPPSAGMTGTHTPNQPALKTPLAVSSRAGRLLHLTPSSRPDAPRASRSASTRRTLLAAPDRKGHHPRRIIRDEADRPAPPTAPSSRNDRQDQPSTPNDPEPPAGSEPRRSPRPCS